MRTNVHHEGSADPAASPVPGKVVLDMDAYGLLVDVAVPGEANPVTLFEYLQDKRRLGEQASARRIIRALERCNLGLGPGGFRKLRWEAKIDFLVHAGVRLDKSLHLLLRAETNRRAARPYLAARKRLQEHSDLDDPRFIEVPGPDGNPIAIRFDGTRAELKELFGREPFRSRFELLFDPVAEAAERTALAEAQKRRDSAAALKVALAAARVAARKRRRGPILLDLNKEGHVVRYIPGSGEDPEVPTLREHLIEYHGLKGRSSVSKLFEAVARSYPGAYFREASCSNVEWTEVLSTFYHLQKVLDERMDLDLFCDRYPARASSQGSAAGVLGKYVLQSNGLLEEEPSFFSSFIAIRLNGTRDQLRAFLHDLGLSSRIEVLDGDDDEEEFEEED